MASNPNRARANDSMHMLVDTGDDLLKPINVNLTNPKIENPFVRAHAEHLRKLAEKPQNGQMRQGQ